MRHILRQISKEDIYKWGFTAISIFSIILIVFDYAALISLNTPASKWFWINNILLVILAIEYFYGLYKASDKKLYFKNNIFELLSILPISIIFVWSNMAQVAILIPVRILRLIRLGGLMGRLRKTLHTHDLLYVIYFAITFILLGAVAVSLTEHVSLDEAFWWAISTASTVGYGDISMKTLVPRTLTGKLVTLIMILLGIGVVGMLTSSLTTYFVNRSSHKSQGSNYENLALILTKLENLEKQNEKLVAQNEKMQKEINELKLNHSESGLNKFRDWVKDKEKKI